ncbi:glycosyltransferase [bacterium]|nr:glycosyltransferase [bacterium]
MTRNMLVSIVTPSYNQAAFLEETIQSVFNQTYQDLEYIIIDGGSTDGSQEIIHKYETKLAYSQSKKDGGYADAINQGWMRATGDILAYLNSDDLLEKDALQKAVHAFSDSPDTDVVYGDTTLIDARGNTLSVFRSEPFDLRSIFQTWNDPVRQPSAFIRKSVWDRFGGLDESFQFCADFEYWIRIAGGGARFLYVPDLLSRARTHSAAKSVGQQDVQAKELIRIFEKFRNTPVFTNSSASEKESWKALYRVVSEHYINAGHNWDALRAYNKYSTQAFSGFERAYRTLRFIGRLMFRS